jgi:hypothetical protein
MRTQPIEATPWEMEAARRREVIASDFGASREPSADPRARSIRRIGHVRRLAAMIRTLARAGSGTPASRVDRSAGCQPRVGAIEPGS